MSWETYYKTHLTTIDGIVDLLPKENAVILAGQAAAEPKAILHAMAERRKDIPHLSASAGGYAGDDQSF